GLTADDAVQIARWLRARGDVDLLDCSSGGVRPDIRVHAYPGYQVPFADRIRAETGLPTGALGMITAPEHAAEILENGRADLVFIGRAVLADPGWTLRAAHALGVKPSLPPQYLRARL
ncbi:MAG: oxidoreductase, partial [Pseudomonadota bacterium]|nr:oxidoreductase [Pseudomonadota bacterium]